MPARSVRIGLVADGYHEFGLTERDTAPGRPTGGARLAAQAQEAQRLGYDLFALSDHLHGPRPTFDPRTALTWAAAATTRLVVLTDVLGLPYRHPAVLAKMAESLDRLSGGRFVLGIGNGGYEPEFEAFGLPSRWARNKVDALDDALHVMHALWETETASVEGNHYRVRDAQLRPRPGRCPPVWVSGYGPRSLATVGRLADGWLPSLGRLGPDGAREALDRIRTAAVAAGRDPDTLTPAANVTLDSAGSNSAETKDDLRAVIELGFDTLLIAGLGTSDTRRWFSERVMPDLR